MRNIRRKLLIRSATLLVFLTFFSIILFIVHSLSSNFDTSPTDSEASSKCNEDCSLKDGRLYSCTPPDGDGTTRDMKCNLKGRVEVCGNVQYCCPAVDGQWSKDLTPCLTPTHTPTPTPLPTNTPTPVSTPEPTPENLILGDYDKSGKVDILDFVFFAKYYQTSDLRADLNKDVKIDIYDFEIFRIEYLKHRG